MTAQDRCGRCGTALSRDTDGSVRCVNGHTQTDASAASDYARLVDNLNCLRALLEDDVLPELRSLRGEVEALRAERDSACASEDTGWVDLATEAERIGRSRDWLRDHARELGGWQSKPRGRWKFRPAVTDARLAAFEAQARPEEGICSRPGRPGDTRAERSSVPLLPVNDRAA